MDTPSVAGSPEGVSSPVGKEIAVSDVDKSAKGLTEKKSMRKLGKNLTVIDE